MTARGATLPRSEGARRRARTLLGFAVLLVVSGASPPEDPNLEVALVTTASLAEVKGAIASAVSELGREIESSSDPVWVGRGPAPSKISHVFHVSRGYDVLDEGSIPPDPGFMYGWIEGMGCDEAVLVVFVNRHRSVKRLGCWHGSCHRAWTSEPGGPHPEAADLIARIRRRLAGAKTRLLTKVKKDELLASRRSEPDCRGVVSAIRRELRP